MSLNETHDIDTIRNYAYDNWIETEAFKPEEIFREVSLDANGNVIVKEKWMFVNCIQIFEDDTVYALLDMQGNADAINDTTFGINVYSKASDDYVKQMYDHFLKQVRALAKLNNIGVYAFVQAQSSRIKRSAFYSERYGYILLTRRGKGHAA